GPVDQAVHMPVTQLCRYDSADLSDPRRQGLELHRALSAWVTDHGCDSPMSGPVRRPEEHGVRIQQDACVTLPPAVVAGGLVRSVIAGKPRVTCDQRDARGEAAQLADISVAAPRRPPHGLDEAACRRGPRLARRGVVITEGERVPRAVDV